ncbi:MAG: mechanosensitive ion channel family protein [Gammaproteobacteria bacterium]
MLNSVLKRVLKIQMGRVAVVRAWGLVLAIVLLGLLSGFANAQSKPGTLVDEQAAPVIVWNREITQLRAYFENISPAQRAISIEDRILAIPTNQPSYTIEAKDAVLGKYTGAWVLVNNKIVFGLMTQDANIAEGESFDAFKQKAIDNLQAWLAVRAEQEKWPAILEGLALSITATLVFGLTLFFSLRFGNHWLAKRNAAIFDEKTLPITIGDVNIKPYLITLEIGVFRISFWGLSLAFTYVWATFVLNQFPYSEPWGSQLSAFLLQMFKDFGMGIVDAIPDLFTVLVIFLLTRLFVRVIIAFFHSAESGIFQSVWLQPETARATRRMVVVLIWIFALVIAYPYLPGAHTEAFKGVSVFVGLMLSLGSAGMVGQVVGGLVVVYSRAFRTGEYVKIGEYEGEIREIGILSTKMLTLKQEEITIPNAVLVGSTTVNYSRHAEGGGSILSTSVTIGYDAPWRQVHSLLLMASERTQGVLNDPTPRVLQRSLSDFYVEYQLLFRIKRPEQRYLILSELHGEIQDAFNEYGVQIMSPHFEAQPNTAIVVPKGDWRKPPAGN